MPIQVFYPFFDYWLSFVLTDLQKVTICSGYESFTRYICSQSVVCLFIFLPYDLCLCVLLEKSLPTPESCKFSPKLSSGNFVVLSFICRIHIVLGIDIYEWCEVGI